MRELYVSLGHNSSAVLAEDGIVVRGYEQERLDRKKSSSAFPKEAIEAALGPKDSERFCDAVYVSHWFDELELETNKYLDYPYLSSLSPRLMSLEPYFTHHDAHAQSALRFASTRKTTRPSYVIVIDGFGTLQECLSVYQDDGHPIPAMRLDHRSFGYGISLGLMYQYVAEYLGLKPNRDEYKLLGYESHILEHVPRELAVSNRAMLARQGVDHAHRMLNRRTQPRRVGTLIDYSSLTVAKAAWTEQADQWRKMWPERLSEKGVKACVAFSAQTFIEACVLEIVNLACPNRTWDLTLTGGCFYNVKLSRAIRCAWPGGNTFVHPLAGDQGAAMGHSGHLMSHGLAWGDRTIGRLEHLPKGCTYVDAERWVDVAVSYLADDVPVNVVRGGGEYGPRALCNTTTLAGPTRTNVELINLLNARDDAMPMAPVINSMAARKLLNNGELDRAKVSERYMITTIAFQGEPPVDILGVAHKDPLNEVWTARPQVVDDGPIGELLAHTRHGCLINTSFNFHGEPIVQSEEDAVRNHVMQVAEAEKHDLPVKPVTLLVRS